jgi:type IV pilus assembly protein PilE
MKSAGQSGFTLVELMITVVIVAILAAVAFPSYTQYVRRAHRADAQAVLMNVATRQQQYLLDSRAYAGSLSDLNVAVPSTVLSHYTVSVVVGTSTVASFSVTATPLGPQAQDSCSAMSLDQAGVKSPASCW